jgi:hypothetical protein
MPIEDAWRLIIQRLEDDPEHRPHHTVACSAGDAAPLSHLYARARNLVSFSRAAIDSLPLMSRVHAQLSGTRFAKRFRAGRDR